MLILALDTTTRAGSLSLVRDDVVLETFVGEEGRTHATRLPGDILDCLARHGHALGDIDLYGVAAGPGSFTGLRIGIATIQGLAFAHGRPVVGVSALDALAESAVWIAESAAGLRTGAAATGSGGALVAAWMDAQRGEVYACLYEPAGSAWLPGTNAVVRKPEEVLAGWVEMTAGRAVTFVGDGAIAYAEAVEKVFGRQTRIIRPVPPLAPAIARISHREAEAGRAVHPHAVHPVYIRRPDAELARDRRAGQAR